VGEVKRAGRGRKCCLCRRHGGDDVRTVGPGQGNSRRKLGGDAFGGSALSRIVTCDRVPGYFMQRNLGTCSSSSSGGVVCNLVWCERLGLLSNWRTPVSRRYEI